MTPADSMTKPLPHATEISRPFWEGLRIGEIRLQRCTACEHWIFYPRSHCPQCLATELSWYPVSGRGRLHTFTITRTPTVAMFADEVPQRLAIVELQEGVRMTSTLVGIEDESNIVVGMALEPVFEPTNGGEGILLRFRPATA